MIPPLAGTAEKSPREPNNQSIFPLIDGAENAHQAAVAPKDPEENLVMGEHNSQLEGKSPGEIEEEPQN